MHDKHGIGHAFADNNNKSINTKLKYRLKYGSVNTPSAWKYMPTIE